GRTHSPRPRSEPNPAPSPWGLKPRGLHRQHLQRHQLRAQPRPIAEGIETRSAGPRWASACWETNPAPPPRALKPSCLSPSAPAHPPPRPPSLRLLSSLLAPPPPPAPHPTPPPPPSPRDSLPVFPPPAPRGRGLSPPPPHRRGD